MKIYKSFLVLKLESCSCVKSLIFRWQILNEEMDCTEEEMMLFAALQLQVAMQANVPQPSLEDEDGDDVDEELKKLQMALEGGGGGGGWDVTEDPSIADYLQYFKLVAPWIDHIAL